MTLSALIHKGGLARTATATPATTATHKANKPVTVAPVATVTVAKGTEQASALSPIEEKKIRLWLAHIGETDSGVITDLLNSCSDDMDTRRYLLQRSEEVPKPVTRNNNKPIICGDCTHFERIEHPHIGHCAKGEPEAIAGLWGSDRRHCKYYLATPTTGS